MAASVQEYEKLCQLIWHHSHLYYSKHAPEISDENFDLLYKKLEEMEKSHPEWISPTSPTQRVSENLTLGFQAVNHLIPMLSLANSYDKEEIVTFIKRIHKLTGKEQANFSAELKMDGIAVTALYEKGHFVKGVTRGNGWQGDDITANMRTILTLPLRLHGEKFPDKLEVRGEVFMTHAMFATLNQQKMQEGEVTWANPRNAAAGSLKLLNPKETAKRNLSIAFYGIAENEDFSLAATQSDLFHYLRSLGLPTLSHTARCSSIEEIWQFIEKIKELRSSLTYDIDGVVIKLDELKEQKRLGATGKHPRWAIAYKFAALQAFTKIKEITVQVGRTGVLTPVAELEPVFLAGSTIARATLHNEEEILRKDIRIGDEVIIEKGGDVIPKVVSVNLQKRPSSSLPWKMPLFCPACQTATVKVEGEVAIRCPNEKKCPEQQVRRLIYFAGKQAFDIEHLGEKVIWQLFQKKLISKPADIFRLDEEKILQLEGFKKKSTHNLLSSIERSKEISLQRFIMGLSIKYVGTAVAELLATKVGSIAGLTNISAASLQKIEGIGEKVAQAIITYFQEQENLLEIEELLNLGVTPKSQKLQLFTGHYFENKQFVLTGTLENYTRAAAATLIKERGGKILSTISKKTDYLLAGKDPGSKLDKAHLLQVKVLDEASFISLL